MNRRFITRLASLALGLTAAWLVAFHLVLFWQRIADATIHHPGVLARWIASALLIAGGWAAHRYTTRRLGRRHITFVFWLLVLLLHVSIPAEERLTDTDSIVALVAQTGLAAAPAIFLAFALAGAALIANRTFFATASAAVTLQVLLLGASVSPRAPPIR